MCSLGGPEGVLKLGSVEGRANYGFGVEMGGCPDFNGDEDFQRERERRWFFTGMSRGGVR